MMRHWLLLISLCVAYTSAGITSEGFSKPCVGRRITGGFYSTKYKGCWINGVCQPYGKRIEDARACLVYACKQRGQLSYVQHEVRGCLLFPKCYKIGEVINVDWCKQITCTYSSNAGYSWKEKVAGCLHGNACYQPGKKYKIKNCRYAICIKRGNLYSYQEKVTGCPMNGDCLSIGKRKQFNCIEYYCQKVPHGAHLQSIAKGCKMYDECLSIGKREQFGCTEYYCRQIGHGTTYLQIRHNVCP